MNKKKNIIIVMTDQQRADLRKSKGYALDTMPFLDKWSETGTDFEYAYTPNPTCLPARVSLFTGRYPSAHKARTNHNGRDAVYTEDLLDILKRSGYKTALCGKNHSHREPADFDYFECNGHLGRENENNRTPEEELFADFLCSTKHMEMHAPSPGGIQVQYPYRNVSSAFDFIDGPAKRSPFFIWLSFAEPHNPYQVPEPYFDLFPPESLPEIKTGPENLKEKGARFEWMRKQWERVLGKDIETRILRARSNYHGMLRLIDDQFKRLIQGLEERGIAENTIVVFLSDHGDFVGEYGLIRKGADLPEVLTRIPMIWNGPDIAANAEHGAYVSLIDVFPTLCDMIGVTLPLGCQGKSLKPILCDKKTPQGEFETAYSENGFSGLYWSEEDYLDPITEGATQDYTTFDCLNTWSQCGQVRMLRKGDYKIQVDMMGTGYLYNLKNDPYETENLWNDEKITNIKADIFNSLISQMLKTVDVLPAPRFRYKTKTHPKGYWNQKYICKEPTK